MPYKNLAERETYLKLIKNDINLSQSNEKIVIAWKAALPLAFTDIVQ